MKRWFTQFVQDMHLPAPPFWMIAAALVLVPASWLPLAFIFNSNVTLSEKRPINLFQGMDQQPRFDAQDVNPVFADHRAMRPPVPGTVAADALLDADHFLLGYETDDQGRPVVETVTDPNGNETQTVAYYTGYPEQVEVDLNFIRRGQQRYNIFCYPCHGKGGYGNGPINERATRLAESGSTIWVPASNLNMVDTNTGELTYGEANYPAGKLYNTITNGIRNMAGYGSQITPEDRWAIIAYIRALQLSQRAPEDTVPTDVVGSMR